MKVVRKPLMDAWKARHRMTDEDIARAIQTPVSTWVKWLHGKNAIKVEALLALATLTGYEPASLLMDRVDATPRTAEEILDRNNLPGAPRAHRRSA